MKYKLYTYDLWGNEKDGYQVSDVYPSNITIELTPNDSDETIIKKLRKEMTKKHHTKSFDVDGDFTYGLYINLKGVPFCELRPVTHG